MKRILLILGILVWSGNFSCTTKATSAELSSVAVQETTVARNVTSVDFKKIHQEKQTAIVLDVRTPNEVAQGVIAGARNIDISSQNFRTEIGKFDKTLPVLVYCRSGRRSAAAMRYMMDIGFTEVYNLEGGIIAWNQAGFPIVKE